MTKKRFENRLNKNNLKFLYQNPVWDNEKEDALNVFEMIDLLNQLNDENNELKKFKETVAEVIESKMGDNVCNDYKMEVLKEIWEELKLEEVWFE